MDIRYAAGLFDGEGFVRVAKWAKPNSVHVRYQVVGGIGMTHRPVIEALQDQFGGQIYANRHDLRNPKNRIQFMWHFASQIGASFLRQIAPHLIVKKEEVELALELQDDIDKYRHKLGNQFWLHPQRDEIFAHRDSLALRISALKKRAFLPPVESGPSGSVNRH